MNITQEQIEAIANKILAEYQATVEAELLSCLHKEKFDYLVAMGELSQIYHRHCGRLYGLIDLLSLESPRYFSPLKETVRAVIEQLLEQSSLNGRVLLDISDARRHGKYSGTLLAQPLTHFKTDLPEIADGVTMTCPSVPGDKLVQQAPQKPYLIWEHGNAFTLPSAIIFYICGKKHRAIVGGLFCEVGYPVAGSSQ
ncbi:MAG: hypothetical protein Q8L68_05755 [Methylococcales bacterium]|nr:hypothetical protein [Methylococcales bacterium]